ncbi:Williams Beuren syndrome chromosome region 22 protein [Dermatophagoides farinae]|uniref:18S rRNA (guanine-N(7))-methyltransferase n=1 Tax=Dermatophagoides farinae TaxID=6954 RepID=A0A922I0X7_DERFA|nr:Williams Beuren syndrome chromosome region 22 protein [Dermatophagoides farinae]
MSRPEHQAPPEIFYNESEAKKYTRNTRIIEIQSSMSERAIELLALPDDGQPKYLLDLGCGSGLSGEVLEENGHYWIGLDISSAMLDVSRERECETGDTIQMDLGHGLPFRAGTFDGAISISALQWLCNVDKRGQKPGKRLSKLFSSLYACLSRGAKAVFQFYPENSDQIELITKTAMKAGFYGGLVIDFPNSSKAKKVFLVLFTGVAPQSMPKALGTGDDEDVHVPSTVDYDSKRERIRNAKNAKVPIKSRQWIMDKKDRYRRQGKDVRDNSKYTGRRRCGRF